MKKLLSLLLIALILLSVTACKNGKNNGDSSSDGGVLTDENANAGPKDHKHTLIYFSDAGDFYKNNNSRPENWYFNSRGSEINYLESFKSNPNYFEIEYYEGSYKNIATGMFIEDTGTLASVIESNTQYKISDLYTQGITEKYIVVAFYRNVYAPGGAFRKFDFKLDKDTKTLTITESFDYEGSKSNNVHNSAPTDIIDLVLVERSLFEGVSLGELTLVYEEYWEEYSGEEQTT